MIASAASGHLVALRIKGSVAVAIVSTSEATPARSTQISVAAPPEDPKAGAMEMTAGTFTCCCCALLANSVRLATAEHLPAILSAPSPAGIDATCML